MCANRKIAETKVDRLIESMDRLSAAIERMAAPVATFPSGKIEIDEAQIERGPPAKYAC